MHSGLRRRSGPLFGVVLVLVALIGLVTPAVPGVAAMNPPDPVATPSADASATPTPDPTQPPDSPTPAPSVSTGPSDSPSPSDSALPSGSPAPSESATPSLGPTQQAYGPYALANPDSPHIVPETLSSDTCAVCHRTHDASNANLLPTTYRLDPLRSTSEPYQASDFALCWACHSASEAAIEDTTGATPGTNFPSHGFHLQSIGSIGTGTGAPTSRSPATARATRCAPSATTTCTARPPAAAASWCSRLT